jgi:hypothetical protein
VTKWYFSTFPMTASDLKLVSVGEMCVKNKSNEFEYSINYSWKCKKKNDVEKIDQKYDQNITLKK